MRAALAPHWGALLALALFLVAGLAVLDDYGVVIDSDLHRREAEAHLVYLAGGGDLRSFINALYIEHDKFYGMTFEISLVFAERAFGIEDSRAIYLSRYLITHLLYLSGGLFAYLLARRLFGGRLPAVAAMLLFLLHPRLYAHSFFNAKDIPFLAMFMIALYLTHRAFRRDRLAAFALLGVGVGVLVNLRIMGVVLLAAVPALRALDFALASGWEERKRILVTTGAYALASATTIFALLPYLWGDPVGRAVEAWTTLSNHPTVLIEPFRGTLYRSENFPPEYLPAWIAITSPAFALALGAVGAAGMLAAAAKSPRDAMRNGALRFGALTAGCFAAPVLAAISLDANMYSGWRQTYFLWAPFSLLAAFGLHWLARAFAQPRFRAAVYGAAGAGLAATAASMALLHPNQQDIFNFLVDRVTPEHLRTQFIMNALRHPDRQAIEGLLDEHPGPITLNGASVGANFAIARNVRMLPREARARISTRTEPDAFAFSYGPPPDDALGVHSLKVYGNTIASFARKPDLRAAYAAAKAGEPVVQSGFDVHHGDGALVYVKEPCDEAEITDGYFMLRVVPEDSEDLPEAWRTFEYEDRSFLFPGHGALLDEGRCVASVPLPDYPVAAIRTGQWRSGAGWLWESDAALHPDRWRAMRRAVADGEPAARGAFDVYFAGDALIYLREPCEAADADARFFLHVVPERADDLPRERRPHGFDNLGFDFHLRGARLGEQCIARADLPDYPVSSIRTGQYASGVGEIWSAEFAVGR